MQIKKRDNKIVEFDKSKIESAIKKAITAVGEKEYSDILLSSVLQKLPTSDIVSVEQIQDIVEDVLIDKGFKKEVKAYIIYREQRRQAREFDNVKNESNNKIDSYLDDKDWEVRENANTTFSLQGLNHYGYSYISKKYWLNKIYPKEIRDAYYKGDIHIHDLGGLANYCEGWSLMDLLSKGFKGVPGKIESSPAKHFRTALGQVVNFIFSMSAECMGAVAFSNFDTLLAPFIYYDNLNYSQVKQALQEFLFNMCVSTRTGFQPAFSNVTLDLSPSVVYAKRPVVIGGKLQDKTYSEFQKEMDMFNKAFFETMMEGDSKNSVFTFPIPTINITKNFPWNNPALEPMWEANAKYGICYFANYINSDMDPNDVLSMCCRLSIRKDQLKNRGGGGLFGSGDKTGSIGVVTTNMARIGYVAKTKEEYFKLLEEKMELAKKSLELKRKAIERWADKGLYPYTKYYLSETKEKNGSYFANHFSTIGLLGMNESLLNFIGKDIGTPEGIEFTKEVMNFMRSKLLEYQKETGNLYNLEASPCESCLDGNTLIKTLDGDFAIKDLVGKTPVVYTYDEKDRKIKLKKANRVWKTSEASQIYRVWFDDGTFIDCTGNHPFAHHSNGKGTKPITWVPAALLKQNYSLKAIDFNNKRYCIINSRQHKTHIVYEYFSGEKIKKGEVIHHKDFNKFNDSYENLQKMTDSAHRRLHYMACTSDYCKCRGGDKNPFYGQHHSDKTKEILRNQRVGKPIILKNITKEEFRKKQSEIAKAKPYYKHSKFRKDIKDSDILDLYNEGKSAYDISKLLNCNYSLIVGRFTRLKLNHKVVKVELLEGLRPVYNMDVEDTNCFFSGSGVLVHNTSYRMALKDKKEFPDIITAGIPETPFYTNSTQLPVNYTDDVFEALKLQDGITPLFSGGSVHHIFVGERLSDIESVKSLIKTIFTKFRVPYISLTPTFSICEEHGYINGEVDKCPQCDKEVLTFSRIVGYLRPVKQFNEGKKIEYSQRKLYKL